MNNLQIFNYETTAIRTIVEGETFWWVAKDVCEYFGDTDHKRSVSRLDENDRKLFPVIDSIGREQMTTCINESGLYALLFNFQPEKAKRDEGAQIAPQIKERIEKIQKFKKWVTSEVLPSIRKTGKYEIAQKSDEELILIGYEKLMEKVKVLTEKSKALDTQVKKLVHDPKTYTTTELAKELHMRSAQELNEKLRDMDVQYKLNGTWVLTAKYSEKGFTDTKQLEKDGIIIYNTQWTGLGRQFIVNLFSEDNQRCA